MIRTSWDVCKTDVRVSALHLFTPQANAARHRSADGLWEPRLYVINSEPTGDFPGLDGNVALDLCVACDKWLAAEPLFVEHGFLPTHWSGKWADTGGIVKIDPSDPDGIDDPDRLRSYMSQRRRSLVAQAL